MALATAVTDLVMPKLGLTMGEGLVAEWRVGPGDRVRSGDVLFIVETEKIATEIEAPADGEMVEILVAAGETVPVGTTIARWTGSGLAAEDLHPVRAARPFDAPSIAPATPIPSSTAGRRSARTVATPYARRLAHDRGIDLGHLVGSGPGGRIKAADVKAAQPPNSEQLAVPVKYAQIATEVDVGHAEAMRDGLNRYLGIERISLTDFVIAGLARTLAKTGAEVLYGTTRITPATLLLGRSTGMATSGSGTMAVDRPAIVVVGPTPATYMAPTVPSDCHAALGIGSVRERTGQNDGSPPREELGLVLSWDPAHVTTAAASELLAQIVDVLEHPEQLLL